MAGDVEDYLKRDLLLCGKGNSNCFNGVVSVAAPMVRGFVRRYFEVDARDDVVQEIFLQVFRSARRYDSRLSATSWILGIAHHVIVDEIRRRNRKPSSVSVDLTQLTAVSDGTSELEDLILRLPRELFEVIYATKVVGLSYEESAKALSIPLGTVKSRVHTARRELANLIHATEDNTQITKSNLA